MLHPAVSYFFHHKSNSWDVWKNLQKYWGRSDKSPWPCFTVFSFLKAYEVFYIWKCFLFLYIYIVFKCIFLYYNTQGGNIVKYCNFCVCQLVKYLGKNIWGFKNSIFFSLYRTKNGGTYWTILYCCIPNIHTDPTTTEEMYCKYEYTSLFPSVFWVCFSVHCLAHHFYHSPLLHFSTTAIYNFYYCSMCKIIY